MRKLILGALVLCLLILAVVIPAYATADDQRKTEIKMGRDAVEEVERDQKFVTDPQIVERVDRIGQAIAKVANSETVPATYGNSEVYQFDYTFKVVADKSVNAFSLPGGFVYVNQGLLDYCQSDHELAGVLAHEVAHAAHHHMTYLLKQESKLDGQIALLLLAGMLTRVDAQNLGNLLLGAQLVRIARSSGYGQKAEADADSSAVVYAEKAGFNPVGALTFLERLAHDYATTPGQELGILQTHPDPMDRCQSVETEIKALGLPLNRRAVMNALKAVTESGTDDEQQITKVKLGDNVLFEPAPIANDLTSEQRAQIIATKVNQLLDKEPVVREITVSRDGSTVMGQGEPIIVVTAQDADLTGKSANEVAQDAALVLRRAIWREMIERMY
jgi:predicted Zn-dependent protease